MVVLNRSEHQLMQNDSQMLPGRIWPLSRSKTISSACPLIWRLARRILSLPKVGRRSVARFSQTMSSTSEAAARHKLLCCTVSNRGYNDRGRCQWNSLRRMSVIVDRCNAQCFPEIKSGPKRAGSTRPLSVSFCSHVSSHHGVQTL